MRDGSGEAVYGVVEGVERNYPYPPVGEEPAGLTDEQKATLIRGTMFTHTFLVSWSLSGAIEPGSRVKIKSLAPVEVPSDDPFARQLEASEEYVLFLNANPVSGEYRLSRMPDGRMNVERGHVYIYCSLDRSVPAQGEGQGQDLRSLMRKLRR